MEKMTAILNKRLVLDISGVECSGSEGAEGGGSGVPNGPNPVCGRTSPSGGALRGFPAVRRWAMIRLGRLGDVVLATGVLDWYARRYGLSFTVITRSAWAELFTGAPWLERVVALEDADLRGERMLRSFHALAGECAGCGLLDWHVVPRSLLLRLFWKGPVRSSRKMSLRRRFFLTSGGRFGGQALRSFTVPQRYALSFEAVPPPANELAPRLYLTEAELARGARTAEGLPGAAAQRPVALHPFATHPRKTWPPETWRVLARLCEARGLPWLVVGRGEPLFPGHPADFTNRTGLRETAGLLAASRVLVSGDSGPMHLGTAVGVPVIALFGPTTREWGFMPSGPHDVVLERERFCRPCSLHGRGGCRDNGACLTAITPECVLDVIASRDDSSACRFPKEGGEFLLKRL